MTVFEIIVVVSLGILAVVVGGCLLLVAIVDMINATLDGK